VPGIFQVILLSMLAHRRHEIALGPDDVLVQPELPPDLSFTSLDRHSAVLLDAHRGAAQWIAARVAASDPKVMAVIGSSRGPLLRPTANPATERTSA
jgi:hypothetical protein